MRPDPLPGSPGGGPVDPTAARSPHLPPVGGTMGPFHQQAQVAGHHAEIPLPAPRPNPSDPGSPGGGRWFLAVLIAIVLASGGGLYLIERAERAERDARVSDNAAEFTTGTCDP